MFLPLEAEQPVPLNLDIPNSYIDDAFLTI